MNKIKYTFLLIITFLMLSCGTVSVVTDYDTNTNFTKFKTFAFYKKGIDKAPISDLDKKRIMRSIEADLKVKGISIAEDPDVLISVFTKSKERVDINDGFYGGIYGGFYYPWYYGSAISVNMARYTEGTLFIDVLDAKTKELLWQGIGRGALTTRSPEAKTERINEFVKETMKNYPPNRGQK